VITPACVKLTQNQPVHLVHTRTSTPQSAVGNLIRGHYGIRADRLLSSSRDIRHAWLWASPFSGEIKGTERVSHFPKASYMDAAELGLESRSNSRPEVFIIPVPLTIWQASHQWAGIMARGPGEAVCIRPFLPSHRLCPTPFLWKPPFLFVAVSPHGFLLVRMPVMILFMTSNGPASSCRNVPHLHESPCDLAPSPKDNPTIRGNTDINTRDYWLMTGSWKNGTVFTMTYSCPIQMSGLNDTEETNHQSGAGLERQMTQQLGALAALAEDPGLTPRAHKAAHNHLWVQFQGIRHPLQPSVGTRHVYAAQTYTQVSIHTHKN
jgi:hypothetical protein